MDTSEISALNKIHSEAEKDMLLSIYNIKERALSEPGIRLKWAKNQIELERRINTLRSSIKDEIKNEVEKRIGAAKTTVLRACVERSVKNELTTDKHRLLLDMEEVLSFIRSVNKILDGYNFTIKNALDAAKLEQQL